MIAPAASRFSRAARWEGALVICLLLAAGSGAQPAPGPDQGVAPPKVPSVRPPAAAQAPTLKPTPPPTPTSKPAPAQQAPSKTRSVERERILRQAQSLARAKECEKALSLLDMLEKGGAGDPIAVKLRGDCLRRLERFSEAKDLYRREADAASARGDDPTPLLIELERVTREAGAPEDAFAICLEINRAGAAGAWVRDEMEGLIRADSLGERSLALLKEEIGRRPDDTTLASLMIGALLFLGRDAEALREAQSLDRARSARGGILLDYLRMMDEKELGAPAVACADAALGAGLAGEGAQEALYLKAAAQRRIRAYRSAVESYERAAKVEPGGPLALPALRERANLLVRDLHDLEAGSAAQQDLVASLEAARPEERVRLLGQALIDLANTKLRMGRYEEAAQVCKRVEEEVKEVRAKEDAAFLQAEILFYAGRIDEARTAYERVAREFAGGNRVNDSLDRLILLTRTGDAGSLPLAALGQIAYQRRFGEPARALEICQEARRECGGCPAEEDLLREESLLLLDLGRVEEAAIRADTLAARFPESGASPAVLRAVADRFRERDGETEVVLRRYEEIVVRFPKSHDAVEVRSMLEKLRRVGERAVTRTEEPRG